MARLEWMALRSLLTAGAYHETFSSSSSYPFRPYEADQLGLFETAKRYQRASIFHGFTKRGTYMRPGPCTVGRCVGGMVP